jgi:hypothetical protein
MDPIRENYADQGSVELCNKPHHLHSFIQANYEMLRSRAGKTKTSTGVCLLSTIFSLLFEVRELSQIDKDMSTMTKLADGITTKNRR